MGRYKEYRTNAALRKAVERYFDSISRDRIIQEEVVLAEKDSWGHFVKELRAVQDDHGNFMHERDYVIPPTVGGLCGALNISRQTWATYCDHAKNPQFAETTDWAREQMLAWREKELLRRPAKMLKGLTFDLENNWGWRHRAELTEAGAAQEGGVEDFLRKVGEADGGSEY